MGEDWLKDSVQDNGIFNELDKVNSLRNRIAHHEPICFRLHASEIDTSYIVNEYQKIQTLFSSQNNTIGIERTPQIEEKGNSTLYDLSGKQVLVPKKGHIYIKGNKKVIQ